MNTPIDLLVIFRVCYRFNLSSKNGNVTLQERVDKINYPLVICYIAIENGHRNSEFSH